MSRRRFSARGRAFTPRVVVYLALLIALCYAFHPRVFMRPLDWVVLVGSLASIIAYGLYRGRGSNTVDRYLLAGKSMPWYAMALSIMATQASAITFISTTGQSYVDGMRFVQFYFGMPLAMVVALGDGRSHLSSRQGVHRLRISGEPFRRQDAGAGQRHLPDAARAFSGPLPSMRRRSCLSIIFGWPDRLTTLIIGVTVVRVHGDRWHSHGHLDRRAADADHLRSAWWWRW